MADVNVVTHAATFDTPRAVPGVHPLDHLETHALCRKLSVFTPSPAQIDEVWARAKADLPMIASNIVARRVAYHNPDCFWAIRRKTGDGDEAPRGFAAFLMLNEAGIDALIRGALDATDPPTHYLVGQHERPAAIYVWLVHAKGMLTPALGLVMEKLKTPLYRDVDLIARAVTAEGSQFNDSLGFHKGLWWDGQYYPKIHHYRRTAGSAGDARLRQLRAPYDDYLPRSDPGAARVTAKVVHGLDELMKAVAIRSAVFIGEQQCPYEEEFDGNDFSCSHILAYSGDEPIGCVRIRYFGGFAKLERLAVREAFRRHGAGRKLVAAATELCRTKGFLRLYAHAQSRLLPFWSRLGFARVDGSAAFSFSDYEYVEILKEIDPAPTAIDLGKSPYIILRPEGQWDRPGVLDRSVTRPVSGASYLAGAAPA